MADMLSQLGQSFGTFGWESMGTITLVISITLGALILLLGGLFFMWWKSFYIKVRIYEPYGQVPMTKEEKEQLKIDISGKGNKALDEKGIRFDMVKHRNTHGKFITSKGTPYFNIFMPNKKLEPIPIEFMYDNGVHLLRLSREIFIPIAKPETIISVNDKVSISISENNKWQAWNNMMADRINNKYQDIDAQKKAITYFVIGIVAMVLIGGFILWLIYSSTNKAYSAADKFNQVASGLMGENAPK